MNELLSIIQTMGRKHDNLRVFQDFVEICACAISKPFQDRDERYFSIKSRYTDDEMYQFHQLGQILLNLLEEEPQDVLGQCYMKLQIANKQRGQCFTPISTGQVMANILIAPNEISEKGYFTLNEPTCGSGALIISFCETLKSQGYNPQQQLLVIAQDIDLKSVQMCYVQLSLLGISAIIQHANPIANNVIDTYYTPLYLLQRNRYENTQSFQTA
ncbi:SAM-dependent methyltransferase [Glaesserella parasuis]|uniref:N-6 DNA methylase n=1 Tax=Glaesserella parasuis TaxID=738 RepID=UPI000991E15A|nr:N-6 DNA methylase [Glaesserella parasuis]MCT8526080.1 SAM-dependent methyltransferase [Glaesserella parasuis]MCT8527095.1 SAM-dependent methyltransferase [Glaesserella parasuis]MCT8529210.1 SAM-dependent methyltransferase [Glaesserella parasuis]MCT8532412.1 SAM-dependent methyltransferase [Glaesserella parasuis]MCT8534406.1 SAM-dependent methyltransferase [Glaesserella parasuis]